MTPPEPSAVLEFTAVAASAIALLGASADGGGVSAWLDYLGEHWTLIRFGGHLPKSGYDVQTDDIYAPAPAAPALR